MDIKSLFQLVSIGGGIIDMCQLYWEVTALDFLVNSIDRCPPNAKLGFWNIHFVANVCRRWEAKIHVRNSKSVIVHIITIHIYDKT